MLEMKNSISQIKISVESFASRMVGVENKSGVEDKVEKMDHSIKVNNKLKNINSTFREGWNPMKRLSDRRRVCTTHRKYFQ